LLTEWEAFLGQPGASDPQLPNAGRLLIDVVSARAWRLNRRIAESAWMVDEHTDAAWFHAVRIDAKKLRYLVDATPAFYNSADLDPILNSLKKLQRVLGDFNDAHVQETRLLERRRALEAGGDNAGTVAALGRLAEQCHQRRERLREKVIDGLRQFHARDTQSACRRAFKRAPCPRERPR
jgi:CHAD domain-containing protein